MGCCDAPGLMPIEEALDKLLSPIKPIQTTLSLPLAEALGYVLAEDILSPIFLHDYGVTTLRDLCASHNANTGVAWPFTFERLACKRFAC